jgi:hypothetical protein
MEFATVKVSGIDAIRLLNDHRSRYAVTGQYPFLIGDGEDLERLQEGAELHEQDPSAIIRASFDVNVDNWIALRRKEVEEYDVCPEDWLGEWPGEIADKGSIGLHKNLLTGKFKPEVYLGLAKIEQPWHLPAILKYGAWNECPWPGAHCAFHREWQTKFGAQIVGMSFDVVECVVDHPPTSQEAATKLAWEQYWYCTDIVEQGCESIANLAATLLNSPYWYFWWD